MSECIEWTGTRQPNGYGRRRINGRRVYTHRAAWAEVNGPIPDGMCVCHRCDNPPCVNVDHLFLGTPSDNMRDMWAKGRQNRVPAAGEASPNARLTNAQAAEIRALSDSGMTRSALSREFGVSRATVRKIANRQRYWQWRHREDNTAADRRLISELAKHPTNTESGNNT